MSAAFAVGATPVGRAATIPDRAAERPPALAPIAARGPTQVVVYDRVTRSSVIVSRDQGGVPATASSSRPSISADGGAVAFESDGALVPGDTNAAADVYLWTRATDQVQRLSTGVAGSPANGASKDPSISGDGAVVGFTSTATNLVPDASSSTSAQVYAWRQSAGLALVSVGASGPDATSGAPSVSQDGRVVAFESVASDLVADDTNGVRDVFLRDLSRNATIRASVDSPGTQVGEASQRPSISADGGAVVFDSASNRLDPDDSNGLRDVFVRDLPPAVQVAPDPLDFGEVPLGTPATRSTTVVSVGWTPVAISSSSVTGGVAGEFLVAGDGCTGRSLAYGASCAIVVLHVPTGSGPRMATLSIADTALDSPQLVSLVGGTPAAQVRLEPVVGPPGIVTIVTGSNFPPGARVSVGWDRGISQRADPVTVGPDGAFSLGMLVFHNDRLGPRQLLVTPAPGGPPFDASVAPFLVVAAALQPPGAGANGFGPPDADLILVRR